MHRLLRVAAVVVILAPAGVTVAQQPSCCRTVAQPNRPVVIENFHSLGPRVYGSSPSIEWDDSRLYGDGYWYNQRPIWPYGYYPWGYGGYYPCGYGYSLWGYGGYSPQAYGYYPPPGFAAPPPYFAPPPVVPPDADQFDAPDDQAPMPPQPDDGSDDSAASTPTPHLRRRDPGPAPASSPEMVADSVHLQKLGDDWFRKQNYVRAIAQYRASIAAAPERREPRFLLGWSYAGQGRYDRAVYHLKNAIHFDRQWPANGIKLVDLFGADHVLARQALVARIADWALEDIRDADRLFLAVVALHFNADSRAGEILQRANFLSGGAHFQAFLAPQSAPGSNREKDRQSAEIDRRIEQILRAPIADNDGRGSDAAP